MCWALYVASDKKLPEILWDENSPAFYTRSLLNIELEQLRQFSYPNIVYIGSYEKCSCPFIPSEIDDSETELQEKSLREEMSTNLVEYLSQALKKNMHLEMFLCWDGEQDKSPNKKKTVSLKDFSNTKFPLDELEFGNIIL